MAEKSWFQRNIYDPTDGKSAGPMVSPVPATAPTVAAKPPLAVVGGQAVQSFLDPDMVADIQKVIARRPTDFSVLEQNAKNLEPVIADEMTRTKAAFQLLKTQGKTANAVISSIDLHIRDIQNEVANFTMSAQGAASQKVAGLRKEVEQLNAAQERDQQAVAQLQQQIQNLQDQMSRRSIDIGNKTAEANTAESDITVKVNKFNAAADSVVAALNTKKTTLSSMLA